MSEFLHLCMDQAAGPVRSWSIRTVNGDLIAVQRVADNVAVATVPADPSRNTGVTIGVTPEAGGRLFFTR